MKVKWLIAHYGFGPDHDHIAVPGNAKEKLHALAREMEGTEDLVGIYIPEGTEDVYEPGAMKGRIVGAVRILRMPPDRQPENYFYHDVTQAESEVPRWPYGWPSLAVLNIDPEAVQSLRTLVSLAHPAMPFGSYTVQFQQGPIRLGPDMSRYVNREMVRLFGEPPWANGTGLG